MSVYRSRIALGSLWLGFIASPSVANAQDAPAEISLPAPMPATAVQLAEEWVPWDPLVVAIVDTAVASHRDSLQSNPDILATDKRFPGLIKTAVSAVRKHTTATARRAQRELTVQLVGMIATDMTPDHINQTYDFLKSPAGEAYKKLLASFTDSAEITDEEIVRRMSNEDMTVMNAFLGTPAGTVSKTLYAQFFPSALASLGHTMQQDTQAASKVVIDAMNAHIAKLAKQTKPATPR